MWPVYILVQAGAQPRAPLTNGLAELNGFCHVPISGLAAITVTIQAFQVTSTCLQLLAQYQKVEKWRGQHPRRGGLSA